MEPLEGKEHMRTRFRTPLCKCGCGERVSKSRKGWNLYIHGHNNKGVEFTKEWRQRLAISATGRVLSEETKKKISKTVKDLNLLGDQREENNNNWKGGRYINAGGYINIRVSKNKYVGEHRLVMEKRLRRKLHPSEHVHHKDELVRNNHPNNLRVMCRSMHMLLNWKRRKSL